MIKKIRKAVFPVAGLGTRFLPATKAIPKEMLPFFRDNLARALTEDPVGKALLDRTRPRPVLAESGDVAKEGAAEDDDDKAVSDGGRGMR